MPAPAPASRRPAASTRRRLPRPRTGTPHPRGPALARSAASPPPPASPPASPTEAVQRGTALLREGDNGAAAAMFEAALADLDPTAEETAALLYNTACAYSRLRDFDRCGEPLRRAVNDYGVKFSVVLGDPDLLAFRESRQFDELQGELRGGGGATDQVVKLRAEMKTPFLLSRLLVLGGLNLGAVAGLFIITAKLVAAAKGVEGADDLGETARNFAVNLAAVGGLSFFVLRDLRARKETEERISTEEALGQLQVEVGPGRVVPLSRFRGQYRPLILCGTAAYVKEALKGAERFRAALDENGVKVVAVVTQAAAARAPAGAQLQAKKGFGRAAAAGGGEAGAGEGDAAAAEAAEEAVAQFSVKAANVNEWRLWLDTQLAKRGLDAESAWVQIQMDGGIRSSGTGKPDWSDLAQLRARDDIVTKITGA